jgi:outer membrane receptor for ferrienterochelin and colicin
MDQSHWAKGLFVSTALMSGSAALAQNAAPAAGATGLEEVVVTATRETNTVNRVALSIAAVTQKTLDEQGIKSAQDLTRVVPGLNFTGAAGAGNGSTSATFSIAASPPPSARQPPASIWTTFPCPSAPTPAWPRTTARLCR